MISLALRRLALHVAFDPAAMPPAAARQPIPQRGDDISCNDEKGAE